MLIRRVLLVVSLLILGLLLIPSKVLAVTVSITNSPSTITSDSFKVTVSVSGASTGTNYLRVDVYKDGTSNYFGETNNGSGWYGGSDGTQYFPITITPGSAWSGDVEARIGSPSQSDYDGQGSYKLRIRRYTSSGNQGSEDANQSAVNVTISVPTQTPTPTLTPTPTNAPTPTRTPTPTDAPTPTKMPTSTPLKTPTPTTKSGTTLTPSPTEETEGSNGSDLELAANSQDKVFGDGTLTPTPKTEVLGASTSSNSLLFVALGLIFIVVCGILAYFQLGDKIFIWKKKNL
ncbi:MAG TPA: hypothetical protein VG917_02510 [Patescibacteria group bacterium]|nr:hypothetical protein [Patescibacteria group bacterium]